MIFKCFIPDFTETLDDAVEIESDFIDNAAEKYLMYCYDERDGGNWMPNSSPYITVVDEDGAEHEYFWIMDFSPRFSVSDQLT